MLIKRAVVTPPFLNLYTLAIILQLVAPLRGAQGMATKLCEIIFHFLVFGCQKRYEPHKGSRLA
jgi:hypothetical protein